MREGIQQRLAESFETALELSGGTATVSWMDDDNQEDIIFSANFACSHCGYSMRELEPRLFSLTTQPGPVKPVTV